MSELHPHPDPEINEFEQALLRSIEQAKRGEYAHVHAPEEILARRRGRPAGSVAATRKAPVTLRLDADVLAAFRATGKGWQTRMNDALREWLADADIQHDEDSPATKISDWEGAALKQNGVTIGHTSVRDL